MVSELRAEMDRLRIDNLEAHQNMCVGTTTRKWDLKGLSSSQIIIAWKLCLIQILRTLGVMPYLGILKLFDFYVGFAQNFT
jgi:hypothetical protein